MNEFKERKLAEFDNNFVDWNRCSQINENKNVNDIKQFISDLIDEMVGAIPEKKELPKNIRIDEGFPIDLIKAFCVEDQGFNKCRETLINNLNKE